MKVFLLHNPMEINPTLVRAPFFVGAIPGGPSPIGPQKKFHKGILSWSIWSFLSPVAWGQPISQIQQLWPNSPSTTSRAYFYWENQGFFNESLSSGHASQSLLLKLKSQRQKPLTSWSGNLDITLVTWPGPRSHFHVLLNQAYVTRQISSQYSFSVGRINFFNSSFDQFWWLGLIEPMGVIDPLRQEPQGLLGLSLEFASRWGQLAAFLSPVSLPGIDVPVTNVRGRLESPSVWFQPPPDSALVLGRTVPIRYYLQSPSWESILVHPSWGIRWKAQQGPFGYQVGWLSSPLPQVLTEYDYFLPLQNSPPEVHVRIKPFVGFHQVWNLQWYWEFVDHRLTFEWVSETINRQLPQNVYDPSGAPLTDWVRPYPKATQGMSLTWQSSWPLLGLESIQFGLLWLNQNQMVALAETQNLTSGIKPYRFQWSQALRIRATRAWHFGGIFWKFNAGFLHDWLSLGNWLEASLTAYFNNRWAALARIDLLGISPTKTDPRANPSFFQSFRSYDRILLGINYAF